MTVKISFHTLGISNILRFITLKQTLNGNRLFGLRFSWCSVSSEIELCFNRVTGQLLSTSCAMSSLPNLVKLGKTSVRINASTSELGQVNLVTHTYEGSLLCSTQEHSGVPFAAVHGHAGGISFQTMLRVPGGALGWGGSSRLPRMKEDVLSLFCTHVSEKRHLIN